MDWGLAVGIVGVVISGATLWFVLLDRVEHKRTVRRVVWAFNAPSTMHEVVNGQRTQTATVLRLANIGGSSGTLIGTALIGATVIQTDNPLVPGTVLPGTHHDFKVEPGDYSATWLLLVYLDSADMRYAHALWLPLSGVGALAEDYHSQRRRYSGRWTRRWRELRANGEVGPGGEPYRLAKALNEKKATAFVRSAAPALFDGRGMQIHS